MRKRSRSSSLSTNFLGMTVGFVHLDFRTSIKTMTHTRIRSKIMIRIGIRTRSRTKTKTLSTLVLYKLTVRTLWFKDHPTKQEKFEEEEKEVQERPDPLTIKNHVSFS